MEGGGAVISFTSDRPPPSVQISRRLVNQSPQIDITVITWLNKSNPTEKLGGEDEMIKNKLQLLYDYYDERLWGDSIASLHFIISKI